MRVDYESEIFFEGFKEKKDKRIILYGAGRLTNLLLKNEKIRQYNIVGVCDSNDNLVGKMIEGYKICKLDEIQKQGDLVVINTGRQAWVDIYNRINTDEIDIYYRNGANANTVLCGNPQKEKFESLEEIEKKLEEFEVISFDIFDTVLLRETSNEQDIFELVEASLKKQGINSTGFLVKRTEAEQNNYCISIDEIYELLKKEFCWSDVEKENSISIELQYEKLFIKPRKQVVELINKWKNRKQIYFISDMYLSSYILSDLLLQVGIDVDANNIIVSCEHGGTKADGKLWEYYKSCVMGHKCIHLGDNEDGDVRMPQLVGIETVLIRNSDYMVERSSASFLRKNLDSMLSKLAYGKIKSKLFSNPFSENIECISFDTESDMGYCVLGCLMYTFFNWIIEESQKNRTDILAFLSREGYLFKQIYDAFVLSSKASYAPKSVYVETSRTIMWSVFLTNKEDIYGVFFEGPTYYCTIEEYIELKYGLEMSLSSRDDALRRCNTLSKEEFIRIIDPYVETIINNCRICREKYYTYLNNFRFTDNSAVVDWGVFGTIQYYMRRFLEKDLKGYYIHAESDEKHKEYKNTMYHCTSELAGRTKVKEHLYFIESFFTSPMGTVCRMEETGLFIYGKKGKNQENFDIRNLITSGIIEFVEDMLQTTEKILCDICDDRNYGPTIFDGFLEGGFILSQEERASFFISDTTEVLSSDRSVMGLTFK